MPELPEVETVCRGLRKVLPGRRIVSVTQNRAGLRIPFPEGLKKLKNCEVTGIARRAKYILMTLGNGQTLILHLGMSGRLTVGEKQAAQKHDHVVFNMDDGTAVVFNDARRFGVVDMAETKKIDDHRFFVHLGPEPLDKKFTPAVLAEKLRDKKISVKLAIMDQRVVVGVGNIYASESLFESGIDPARPALSLKPGEIKKLHAAVQKVLRAAIRAGGSSLRDYVQADGELGYFQHHWAVYGKKGQKCRGCTCVVSKTGGIQKMTQGGRSTFYCPVKQK